MEATDAILLYRRAFLFLYINWWKFRASVAGGSSVNTKIIKMD